NANIISHLTLHHYYRLFISYFLFFFFNDTATTEIYTLSLHDALPILAAALTRSDGSIGKLKIDSFDRCTVSGNGAPLGRNVHYAIYSEGLPVSDVEFLGDELKRETRHPVHEGAILYDADGRSLDVVASGGKAVRNMIADSFARNM